VSRISKSATREKINGPWSFGALPIWKSAIRQVWKPALQGQRPDAPACEGRLGSGGSRIGLSWRSTKFASADLK
jgi:hypothetical protein